MKKSISILLLTLFSLSSFADTQSSKSFGDVEVQFSAFNSSFILPSIAETYRITRGKDKGLVNVAVLKKDTLGGQTAEVSGAVSNIFAQQQKLDFFEIREGDSVYYLAPFSFDNEDFLTFKINVKKGSEASGDYSVSFQRTFYHDK